MKPLGEKSARRAVGEYFRWWKEDNGLEYYKETSKLLKHVDQVVWKDGTHVWVFRLKYGGHKAWVFSFPDGSIGVQREMMPRHIFDRKELK